MIFRVNVLCLAGVVIGLLAVLLPWVTITPNGDPGDFRIDDYVIKFGEGVADYRWWIAVGAFAFLAGTALAFSTSLGGVVQGTGLAFTAIGGFVVGDPEFFRDSAEGGIVAPGPGMYLAVASASLVLASMALPIFIGTKKPAEGRDPRFIAWRMKRGKKGDGQGTAGGP